MATLYPSLENGEHKERPDVGAHELLRIVPVMAVEQPLATFLLERMSKMAIDKPHQSINLLFRSGGGSIYEGLGCVDSINTARSILSEEAKIIGIVNGFCYSAGSWLLQTCDIRKMTEHSILMVHGMVTQQRGSRAKMENEKIESDLLNKAVFDAYMKRSTKEREVWEKLLEDDTPVFLSAEEALEWGLVDEIIPVYYPT
jgi:ATP-dependent Clp protease, protease subunit